MQPQQPDLPEKKRRVLADLRQRESVLVALSGGVDSALLLALAVEALGPARVLAVTGDSASLAGAELDAARRVAAELGARFERLETAELERPGYRANDGTRCFHCRDELFRGLLVLARERGVAEVVYGAIADDLADDRPGMRAARLLGIGAPLLEAGLSKSDVRTLARAAGLSVGDKPASACLASRIPVGTPVTAERLGTVERAEAALRELGFERLRVRHHGEVARVELDPEGDRRLVGDPTLRRRVVRALREAGFRFVALDLEGYRGAGLGLARPDGAQRTRPTRDGGQ